MRYLHDVISSTHSLVHFSMKYMNIYKVLCAMSFHKQVLNLKWVGLVEKSSSTHHSSQVRYIRCSMYTYNNYSSFHNYYGSCLHMYTACGYHTQSRVKWPLCTLPYVKDCSRHRLCFWTPFFTDFFVFVSFGVTILILFHCAIIANWFTVTPTSLWC